MEPQVPDYISIIFVLLTFSLLMLIVTGYKKALANAGTDVIVRKRKVRRLAIVLLFWLLFLVKISGMNFFHQWDAMPPRLMIAVLPPLVGALIVLFSTRMKAVFENIPQLWLIGIQSFRIVMEMILLFLFIQKIIPVQMTFEGRNFDILVGITAIPIAYFAAKNKLSKNFILAWNVFGLILLANIVIIAILSTPLSFRVFMEEPANTVIAYFPFVWLPGFVVPVAYTMHFVSIKKCLSEKKIIN